MVAIRVCVDRHAALLDGRDLPDIVTVDVTPDQIGTDNWPELVKLMTICSGAPAQISKLRVNNNTADAVKMALEDYVYLRKSEAAKRLAALRADMTKLRDAVAAEPESKQKCVYHVRSNTGVSEAMFEGFDRQIPYISTTGFNSSSDIYDYYSDAEKAEIAKLPDEKRKLLDRNEAELLALNNAALDAQLPALLQAKADRQAAEAKAEAERQDKEKAARLAKGAARLKSGYWESETSSYNARRYGAPWCARITGTKGHGDLVYEFADSTARHGSAGLLRVACKPGDIIAWGQKDLRNPSKSDHEILRMRDDGLMKTIDRTEAFKLLTATAATN